MQRGTLTDLSIGFDPIKWEMVQPAALANLLRYGASGATAQRYAAAGEPVRVVKEARLWEVSLVTFGAHPVARLDSAAAAAAEIEARAAKIGAPRGDADAVAVELRVAAALAALV